MYYGGGAATKVCLFTPTTHTPPPPPSRYDGARPDTKLAGTCGGGAGAPLTFQKCAKGNSSQLWGFEKNGKSIASSGLCLDIDGFATSKGAEIWAYPCGQGSKDNEYWEIKDGTIPSLQANTPFCVGASGAVAGSTTRLDDCTAPNAAFTIGFASTAGSTGTIVQKASGQFAPTGGGYAMLMLSRYLNAPYSISHIGAVRCGAVWCVALLCCGVLWCGAVYGTDARPAPH